MSEEKTSEVTQADLGSMLLASTRYSLRWNGYTVEYMSKLLRRHFHKVDAYDQRQIVNEIELAITFSKTPCKGWRQLPPIEAEEWSKLVEEIRPPKAAFTLDYRCSKCKNDKVKLWRGVHGCKSDEGYELLCARCLAPDLIVDVDGQADRDGEGDLEGKSDQIRGWLPAVPVGDTYWGYSSVPTADVRWWRALPTYSLQPLAVSR